MKVYSDSMFEDFLNQCREVEKELQKTVSICRENRSGYAISPEIIYSKAILRPAKSFYYADGAQILKAIRRFNPADVTKGSPSSLRRKELIKIYDELKIKFPDIKPIEIANMIDEMPAPRFYIGVSHAEFIYYRRYESNRGSN